MQTSSSSLLLSNSLRPLATKLRKQFTHVMSDPHSPDRFQWDFWHLPGRYTHLRTPAVEFFSDENHAQLMTALQKYGREQLGCPDVSPIWLSLYIEGCEQRLHADRPHGPWAFVLSLTPKKTKFQGGETIMVRPEILSLWSQGVPAGNAFEESDIVDQIPSTSGRLIVFDPRIPHGVSRLSGTMDPLEGRLVVHGWFAQPNPFVDGPLPIHAAEKSLTAFDKVLAEKFNDGGFQSTGTTAFKIKITPHGKVASVKRLACSMSSYDPSITKKEIRELSAIVSRHFLNSKFPKMKTESSLTLPLSFERG